MSARRITTDEYQARDNTLGLLTTNQVNHMFRPDPCLPDPPVRTTMYDSKPLELMMENPLPRHDQHVTTNQVYHGRKFYEDSYRQPEHPKAPGLTRVHYIKPDFFRKVAQGDFNPKPIYDQSVTKLSFPAKHPTPDMYGPPSFYLPPRDTFVPQYKDFVYPFDRDAAHSVIRRSHPYMTTTAIDYRHYGPEEIAARKTLDQLEASEKSSDVAIKYRVRPMLDPFEYKLTKAGIMPPLDREACNYPNVAKDCSNMKLCFNCPPYSGCPPRTLPPIQQFKEPTQYRDVHGPHAINRSHWNDGLHFCYLQPRLSASAVQKTPSMYKTESQQYGGGRNVSTFVKTDKYDFCDLKLRPTKDFTCDPEPTCTFSMPR